MKEDTLQKYNRLFWDKATEFDTSIDHILRKIIHSYSVAEKCFIVACKLGLDKHQREFCYLMGLFHDIGRFKQWTLYQTYVDNVSINHGFLGAEMLEKFVDIFGLTQRENEILVGAIKYHASEYDGDDKDIVFFRDILMDCDAWANVITTANGIQPMFYSLDGVTKELLDDFLAMKPLGQYVAKTKLDGALLRASGAYSIKFDFIRREVLDKKYLDCICETFSTYLNEKDKAIYKQAMETLKAKYLTQKV